MAFLAFRSAKVGAFAERKAKPVPPIQTRERHFGTNSRPPPPCGGVNQVDELKAEAQH